ncbi:T9SS type A sorting domain-containing protein [Algibacter luteus]|uniref:Por secretion system C-terminal sorting domain-containing protein n=1 Tax=Algibacter luteus TaxID=1178825 RepID=A0A1M6AY82_9FLAO|nr:T9SS type A sorting domain-containing protein [Algibacter luteus]SHI41422.1 Por secretion system C-terminal sorting domain-containing protein [Algibacter luteus]
MRKRNLLNLLCVLLTSKAMFAQIMLKEVSLEQQIEKSSLVIEGKVLSKQSSWDANHENIFTINTIEVYKVFKGEAFSTIELITAGGVVGYDAQIVSPSLKLKAGDVGVFTLYGDNSDMASKTLTTNKKYKPFGSLQGFYKYSIENDIVTNSFNSKKGIVSNFYQEIKNFTNTDYIELASFEAQNTSEKNATSTQLAIVSFSPTETSAGTQSVLTITGTNFGTIKGNVSFYNADNAGASFVNALGTQILTWTDTLITVEVPSEAGTGKVKVIHNDGTAMTTNNDLTITYAQANIITDHLNSGVYVAYPTQLVNGNGSGGYTWQMSSEFAQVPEAKETFKKALDTWRCETEINWLLNETDLVTEAGAQHKAVLDDKNTITFDSSTSTVPNEDLPDTVLGLRTSYYSACDVVINGVPSLEWYIREFDIVFDDEADWNFLTETPGVTEFDFESVALHELGHCRQLDHIINTNNVMHYAIARGESLRALSSDNITLASMIQDRSTSVSVCDAQLMTDYSGGCALGVEEDILTKGISLYPNPTKGQLYINTNGSAMIEGANLYDVNGRLISNYHLEESSKRNEIDLSNIAKGVYFLNIYSDAAFITKKIVLE